MNGSGYTSGKEIKRKLKAAIADGVYQKDARLPTVRKLAEIFSASTRTISNVVGELKEEGWLRPVQGSGLFVVGVNNHKNTTTREIVLLSHYIYSGLERALPYPGSVWRMFEDTVASAGYALNYISLERRELIETIEMVRDMGCAAIALFEINHNLVVETARTKGVPVVSIDNDLSSQGISSVCFPNTWLAYRAVKKMIAAGHHRWLAVNPMHGRWGSGRGLSDPVENERMLGYELAMRDAGLDFPYLKGAGPSLLKSLRAILAADDRPDAIFCHASYLIREISQAWLAAGAPPEVKILTFDSPWSSDSPQPETNYISVPNEKLGRVAGELILRLINSPGGMPEKLVVESCDELIPFQRYRRRGRP